MSGDLAPSFHDVDAPVAASRPRAAASAQAHRAPAAECFLETWIMRPADRERCVNRGNAQAAGRGAGTSPVQPATREAR